MNAKGGGWPRSGSFKVTATFGPIFFNGLGSCALMQWIKKSPFPAVNFDVPLCPLHF
jgi:hypothetical protein